MTALKIGLWGGDGGRGGERWVGWVWFTFSTLLLSGRGGWERNCLEGWGERNFKVHLFYNFRGGFFLHASVTHILGLTTLDTYLSKSFLRLGIYYKYPNRDLISLSPFQMSFHFISLNLLVFSCESHYTLFQGFVNLL